MKRSTRLLLSFLVVFVVISSACNRNEPTTANTSESPKTAESPTTDETGDSEPKGSADTACDLLEPGDLSAAFGGTYTEEPDANDNTFCQWAKGGTFALQAVLSVTASPEAGRAAFDRWANRGPAISGLGEAAVWADDETLVVLKSQTLITLTPLGSKEKDLELLKKVAASAVANV